MSGMFRVDTASLERFRATVDRAQDQVGKLKSLAEAARLAPGTFTLTEGGQRADAAHAELLDGVGKTVDAASKRLRAIAEAVGRTIDNYESTDSRHAATMSEIEGRLHVPRG